MLDIYVINLDNSPDRLAHVKVAFSALGLNFTRVAAVDGRALSEEEFVALTQKRHWRYNMKRGELGCLLSHRHCLHLAMSSDKPYTAIFEDDVILSPKIAPLLQDWHWIEPGTDMIKLDIGGHACVTAPLRREVNNGYKMARLLSRHYCTGGYIVSKEAAARLYQITENTTAPIDEVYYNPACGVLTTFNVQQMVPAPVRQAGLPSTIRQPLTLTEVRERKGTRLPLPQKLLREVRRANEKWLFPLWLVLTRRCRWATVNFG